MKLMDPNQILLAMQTGFRELHNKIDDQTNIIHRKIEVANKDLRSELKKDLDDLGSEFRECQSDCKSRITSLETNGQVKAAVNGYKAEGERTRKRFYIAVGSVVTASILIAVMVAVWNLFVSHIEIIAGEPPRKGIVYERGAKKISDSVRPGASDYWSYPGVYPGSIDSAGDRVQAVSFGDRDRRGRAYLGIFL